MEFKCYNCGHREDSSSYKAACSCGGLWTLDYKADKFKPDRVKEKLWSIFRYRDYMAFKGEAWKDISLGEGMTPIIEYDQDLLLKLDYLMPTLSYKDRGAAALIAHAKAIGVRKLVQDSSGNAGNSIAAYGARAGIECQIFVPQGTSPKKISMISSHGAKVHIVEGDRDQTAQVCRQKVEEESLYYANHVYNPIFYQGTKTYIYEVYEQLGYIPSTLVLPIGNGTIFLGAVLALEEFIHHGLIEQMPKILAVQSQNCAPIYQSYISKSKKVEGLKAKTTLAEGIAIGQPARGDEILDYIRKYDMEVILAKEEDILSARVDLARQGLYVEHTTAAIYGAYKEYIDKKGSIGQTLLTLTGAGLKSQ